MVPAVNPSTPSDPPAGPPVLDIRTRDDKPLPRAFESIREQLQPEEIAKLRAVDKSRAQVSLRVRGRAPSPFMPLADFVLDFASEAAQEMQTGGPMSALIEPNDQTLERFAIGFVAPGEVRRVSGSGADETLRAEIKALNEKIDRQQQLVMLAAAGGGGSSLKSHLEELQLLNNIVRGNQPALPAPVDPAAQINAMSGMFQGMCTAMGAGMKSMREVGTQLAAAAPEKSFAAEVREIMAIEGAPKLAATIVDRVLPPKSTSVAGPQGNAAPRSNPLEKIA